MAEPQTIRAIGERALIARLTAATDADPAVVVGPGDDAAVLDLPTSQVVVTTDALVQDRHFRSDWSTPFQIGRKAIAQNGADLAAMGARPAGFVVALGCPPDTTVEFVEELNRGLRDEALCAGAPLVGGDLVQAPVIMVSVTALGTLDGRQAVRLDGARPGDVVAVSGRLGWSAAGLAQLRQDLTVHSDSIEWHCNPRPDYVCGPVAARAGATAMTDVSDGLLADLRNIAQASGVAIDVAAQRVRDPELVRLAATIGANVDDWALTGGEDHALVACFPADAIVPDGWRLIGKVRPGAGIQVDGVDVTGHGGWDSFE